MINSIMTSCLIRSATFLACLALPVFAGEGQGTLRCAPVFGDHAILQQQMQIPVWGQAHPEAVVRVKLGDQSQETRAAADGTWRLKMPAMTATPLPSPDAEPDGIAMEVLARHPDGDETLRFQHILSRGRFTYSNLISEIIEKTTPIL